MHVMASTRVLRRIALAAIGGLIAIIAIAPGQAPAAQQPDQGVPPKPRLPADFSGQGRYIVPDMDVNVPFTWEGRDGDSQMVAGGPNDEIWFENLFYKGTLYTITYTWPGVDKVECVPFQGLDRDWLNGDLLKTSRYVGTEVVQGTGARRVQHWRAGLVFLQNLQPKPGVPGVPRVPAMLADIYVGKNDQTRWWKVLQFGVQNQFDPALDEWLEMDTFSDRPGTVTLPSECKQVPPPKTLNQILNELIKSLFDSLKK
jgi:hypothetical protein